MRLGKCFQLSGLPGGEEMMLLGGGRSGGDKGCPDGQERGIAKTLKIALPKGLSRRSRLGLKPGEIGRASCRERV